MAERKRVPDEDRIGELWAVIKLHLAGKVDTETLKDYPKIDAVVAAITEALANYPTNTELTNQIASALTEYMTASEVNSAIADAVRQAAGLRREVVQTLPETGDENTLYLVPLRDSPIPVSFGDDDGDFTFESGVENPENLFAVAYGVPEWTGTKKIYIRLPGLSSSRRFAYTATLQDVAQAYTEDLEVYEYLVYVTDDGYLAVKDKKPSNIHEEYMYIKGNWELIGSTAVDLTNYWSKDELSIMTAEELKEILV